MKLFFAPLEGVSKYTYRNNHKKLFGDCDAYFAPFITPADNERLSLKCLRDILPEHNSVNLKIQVLANRSDTFMKFAHKVAPLGYNEININLGCPSGTVVKKGRGAGFLKSPDEVDNFLYEIFASTDFSVSVKSRSGFYSGDELEKLVEIYNKYPLSLLIIHPRYREQLYKGYPDMEVFDKAYKSSKNPVCYNGNIFSAEDYSRIVSEYPFLHSVMIGRGALANPAIFREIRGGKKLDTGELIEFTRLLIDEYLEVLGCEHYTLNKVKEVWIYQMWNYPEEKKIAKAIRKASKISELVSAIEQLPELR